MSAIVEPRRPRRVLWIMLLVFFVPLGASFLIYYGSGWRPAGRTNHGELIQPPRPLPELALPRAEGSAASAALLHGKWSLVYVGGGTCDAACRATLHYMRQTHEALGTLIPRVQRVFLATERCCDRDFLGREHPGLITLDAASAAATPLLVQFPREKQTGMIFVVDPLGNLMMRYDANADPKGLREDLKKLLSLSHIG